jgi:hypothetical protein
VSKLRYRKEKPTLIWKSKNGFMSVYFDEHSDGFGEPEMYMELGSERVGHEWGMFYSKINLNGFWVAISEYIQHREGNHAE